MSSIADLEAAANVFMMPPNNITQENWHKAESILINFRKTKNPYAMCREILETSTNSLLLFESADAIKNAIIVEWNDIDSQDRSLLKQYLLNYVMVKELQPYVREKILQVVAIMVKRESVADLGQERGIILDQMKSLFATKDLKKCYIACRILQAIMQAYVTTVKSDDNGLTFAEHFKAKKLFEMVDLKKIFVMTFSTLEDIIELCDLSDTSQTTLLNEILTIISNVLQWGYVSPLLTRRFINAFETAIKIDQCSPLRLSSQWSPIILDPKILQITFKTYFKVRNTDDLQKKCLICIVQLSTLCGPVFTVPNPASSIKSKTEYVYSFLVQFMDLLANIDVSRNEAFGFVTIIRKILLYNLPSEIGTLPKSMLESIIQHMYRMIVSYIPHAVQEDVDAMDESVYNEALNEGLEAWLLMIQSEIIYEQNISQQCSIDIFGKYLQHHLSAPDGLRPPSNSNSFVEICEENDIKDRDKYREPLIIIGYIGRENVAHVLPLLCTLLEDRTRRLHGQLNRIYQTVAAGDDCSSLSERYMDDLYEDLMWLLLISAHVLSTETYDGEQATIPSKLMNYSYDQSRKGLTDMNVTLKVLASPSQCITEFPNAENSSDSIIRLIAAVFRLCEIENQAVSSKLSHFLSPELVANVMWFLRFWAKSYLLFGTYYYTEISEPLKMAFGLDTQGGAWSVGFLLKKICINVTNFTSELQVIEESLALFLSLVRENGKCPTILNSEYFKDIVNLRGLGIPKSTLVRGLVQIGSCITDENARFSYITSLITPIRDNFSELNLKDRLPNDVQKLISLLEEVEACSTGAKPNTFEWIHNCFKEVLRALPEVLNLFTDHQIVVIAILKLFTNISQSLLLLLKKEMLPEFYTVCREIIQTYTSKNINRITLDSTAEEDSLEDLILLLRLMQHLLAKNMLFDTGEDELGDNEIDAGDVCIFGLQYIMPLITLDLMKYPTFCLKYYQTLLLLLEEKSHKIIILPENLLLNMFQSIELGLRSFGPEIQVVCFDILQVTANAVYVDQNTQSVVHMRLLPFLKSVLELILCQEVDTDNHSACAKALYALCCCYSAQAPAVIQQLISNQTTPAYAERLTTEFGELINSDDLIRSRAMQFRFLDRFEKFMVNINFLFN